MSAQNKLYNALIASTYITDKVGTRIYPVIIPQGVAAFPTLVYTRISNNRVYSLSGYTSMENVIFQIDSVAVGFDEVRALAESVHTVLTTTTYFKCIMRTEDDSYEPESNVYRVTQEYSIWNKE